MRDDLSSQYSGMGIVPYLLSSNHTVKCSTVNPTDSMTNLVILLTKYRISSTPTIFYMFGRHLRTKKIHTKAINED